MGWTLRLVSVVALMWLPASAMATSATRRHHPTPPTAPTIIWTQVGSAPAGSPTVAAVSLLARVRSLAGRTRLWFQYGASRNYGASTPAQTFTGTRPFTAQARLSGLVPVSTYHFRLVATSCHGCPRGTAYGHDAEFNTGGYRNPIYGTPEGADPTVLDRTADHDGYWAFTTGDGFPVLHSTDLVHWTNTGTALRGRPAWALQGAADWHPWGPDVTQVSASCPGTRSPGCYVMYYAGLSAELNTNCVAVATAPSPGGPYTDQGPLAGPTPDSQGRAIGCGDNAGYGQIDPSLFVDPRNGTRYLYVSEDFSCPTASPACTSANSTLAPTVSVIPLSADSLHASGARTPLFTGDPGTWEADGAPAPTVEDPSVVLHDGIIYVLYSGGSWHAAYGVGFATASNPLGPFTKSARNPVLKQTAGALSAGGSDVPVTGPHGGLWMLYHARTGSFADPRTLRLDPFSWLHGPSGPDVPVIWGPSSTPTAIQP